jgi:hypothetical protein
MGIFLTCIRVWVIHGIARSHIDVFPLGRVGLGRDRIGKVLPCHALEVLVGRNLLRLVKIPKEIVE